MEWLPDYEGTATPPEGHTVWADDRTIFEPSLADCVEAAGCQETGEYFVALSHCGLSVFDPDRRAELLP